MVVQFLIPIQSDSDASVSSGDVPLHGEKAPVKCRWSSCGQWFSQLGLLSAHVTEVHGVSKDGLFYCGWEGCSRGDRGFNARYKMLVHVRTHTNEKPHHCYQCDKSFSRAENLKIHARSHTGERPYVCPVPGCGKAYSNSSDRFKHTRTHSVEKPYMCKVPGCSKRYTDPSSLRKHVKTYRHFPPSTTIPIKMELDEPKVSEETRLQDSPIASLPPQIPDYGCISHPPAYPHYRPEKLAPWPEFVSWYHWSHPYMSSLQEQETPLDLSVAVKLHH